MSEAARLSNNPGARQPRKPEANGPDSQPAIPVVSQNVGIDRSDSDADVCWFGDEAASGRRMSTPALGFTR
jgi:hypothetical protein